MSKPITAADVANFIGSDFIASDVPQTPVDTDWQIKLAAHISAFNERYANVRYVDKQMIMRFTEADENYHGHTDFDLMGQRDFVNLYQNTVIKTGEKVVRGKVSDTYDNHANAWLKHPDCRVYHDGVVFRPLPIGAKPLPASYYNTWQGFVVEPRSGDWTTIKQHLLEVVCSGDTALYDYLIRWIAYKLQNPHKQAGSAVVLRGKKGSGKGTLGHFLLGLYGAHGMHISNSDHLTGKFNAHLANCCLLFADEAFFSGDKRGQGALKALITEPTITIEPKWVAVHQQPNYLQILMATNEAWAVPVSADDRRYCVIDVSSDRIGDRAYFNKLHRALAQESVKAAFLSDMLNLDLGNWHSGDIPDTDALKDQRLYSLDSVGQFLVDGYQSGGFTSNSLMEAQWRDYINATELYNCYLHYCDRMKIDQYGRLTQAAFGRVAVTEAKLYKDDKGRGKTIRYCLHSIDDYKARLEDSYRIILDKQG